MALLPRKLVDQWNEVNNKILKIGRSGVGEKWIIEDSIHKYENRTLKILFINDKYLQIEVYEGKKEIFTYCIREDCKVDIHGAISFAVLTMGKSTLKEFVNNL
jgi:hypothetical protein